MIPLLLAVLLMPQDTLLVSVELVDAQQQIMVEAVLDADSTLRLPARPVADLLGIGAPAGQWITVGALQRAYPTVRFAWLPLELRVLVFDPLEVLPATRRVRQAVMARARMAFQLPIQSGPFAALAVDDSARALLDAGYSYRGRFALAGRVDDRGAGSWGVTLAPSAHLFLSYADGVDRPPNVSGRIAAGPLWLSAASTPGSTVDVAGLMHVGAVQVFASREYGVLTITPSSQWTVQLAHHWPTARTAMRFSVGPAYANPFTFPVTSLSH